MGYKYTSKEYDARYQIFTFKGKQGGKTAAEKTKEKRKDALDVVRIRSQREARKAVNKVLKKRRKRLCSNENKNCKLSVKTYKDLLKSKDCVFTSREGRRVKNQGSVIGSSVGDNKLRITCKVKPKKDDKKKVMYSIPKKEANSASKAWKYVGVETGLKLSQVESVHTVTHYAWRVKDSETKKYWIWPRNSRYSSITNIKQIPKLQTKAILKNLNTLELTPNKLAGLIEFPGRKDIGIRLATKILSKKEKMGKFTNLEQIKSIRGIGWERFSDIAHTLSISRYS